MLTVQIIQINLVLKNPSYFPTLNLLGSNNTNKLSPQEPCKKTRHADPVQIIQINLVLKNGALLRFYL